MKCRSTGSTDWIVMPNTSPYDYRYRMYLNSSNAIQGPSTNYWANTAPTATQFRVDRSFAGGSSVPSTSATMIAYLFASVDGVSKVGSYTGNGSSNGDSQNIDCGFSNGARFVMIKDTSASSSWFVVDTARGLVSGADKHLKFNTTAAEETDDVIDPYSLGFTVNRFAGEFNQSGRTYIFYAIA